MKSTKNCLTVDIARKGKEKNEKKSNKSFFTFIFLYGKTCIC